MKEYTAVSRLNAGINTPMFLIIHNPLSNNKKSKKTTSKYVKFFQRNDIDFILRSTLKIENLNHLLDQNPSITDILYLGGDGSINYFINNVDLPSVKANIYLAQSGSGNDFMRTIKPLHQGEMTIGSAETDVKNVKFINGCGLGLDGHVGFFVNQDKKKNKMSYFVNTLRALKVYKPTPMDVVVDGVKHHYERTYIVAIQNGKYFGGGMKVAPLGDPRTEEFEVMVAHTLPRWLVFPLFLTIYAGLHVKIKKYVATFRGKDIVVHSDDPKYFQAEGEVLAGVSTIHAFASSKRMIHSFEKPVLLAAKKKQ